MAENPLLPHRKLKELYALILRFRALDHALRGKTKSPEREALLAASSIHLEPGDLIFAEVDDSVAASLAPAQKTSAREPGKKPVQSAEFNLPRLAAAVAAAHSLKPRAKNLVIAHTHENAIEPKWQASLKFAQEHHLPLLFVCAGAHQQTKKSAPKDPNAFTWEAVTRVCKRLRIPLLPVDGEDAVALYRVFQESSQHARAGAAPAVIWAMLHPATSKLPRSQTPVARLEAYCRTRKIKL